MSVKRKEWLQDTIEKLSDSDIEKLQKYVESLSVKSPLSKKDIRNPESIQNPNPAGKPKQILTAIITSSDKRRCRCTPSINQRGRNSNSI